MKLSSQDILYINNIVYDAGKAILDIYDTPFDVETKSDNSPLTQADKNSHLIIESGLLSRFPNIPILSEEGRNIPYSERKNGTVFGLLILLMGLKNLLKEMENSLLILLSLKIIIQFWLSICTF